MSHRQGHGEDCRGRSAGRDGSSSRYRGDDRGRDARDNRPSSAYGQHPHGRDGQRPPQQHSQGAQQYQSRQQQAAGGYQQVQQQQQQQFQQQQFQQQFQQQQFQQQQFQQNYSREGSVQERGGYPRNNQYGVSAFPGGQPAYGQMAYNPHAAAAAEAGSMARGVGAAAYGRGPESGSGQVQRQLSGSAAGGAPPYQNQRGQHGGGGGSGGGRHHGGQDTQRSDFEAGRGPGRGPTYGRGDTAGGRHAPYNTHDSRQYGEGSAAVSEDEGRGRMLQALSQRPHNWQQDVPEAPSLLPALRPGAGTLGSQVNVIVNMYLLIVTGQLLHYDVQFEIVRSRRGAGAGADPPRGDTASQGTIASFASSSTASTSSVKSYKPPANAREILMKFEEQYWSGRNQRVPYAFDGARNLVAPAPPPGLPDVENKKVVYKVDGVMLPGKETPTSWLVSFQLVKRLELSALDRLQGLVKRAITNANDELLDNCLQMYNERRQLLDWILKQIIMTRTGGRDGIRGALDLVNEVGRCLYFVDNSANRNIGGGLCALAGLQSSVKLTEGGLMFAADITSSAFLRTDINLVEWMADVAGFNLRQDGGGRGGRGGGRFGGRGGGRGQLPPVGAPDVNQLLRNRGDRRLLNKIQRALKNKKVVYKSPDSKQLKYQAVGLSAESADQAYFTLHSRTGGPDRQISVAQYYAEAFRTPLKYPQLPVVLMKVPKNARMDKIWLPPEFLWFDKNQRVQNVTHKGGTEQMIESARKDPAPLHAAIDQAVNPEHAAASRALEAGFQLQLDRNMQQVQGRILPGPWLSYQQGGGPGLGQMRAINTGTTGKWNMEGKKFSNPASLLSWGLVSFLPPDSYNTPGAGGLGCWVGDLMTRMENLGLDLGANTQEQKSRLHSELLQQCVWVDERYANVGMIQNALREAKDRASQRCSRECQLVVCFIRSKPSPLYADIKVAAELAESQQVHQKGQELGLVTQVVVAERTDLGKPQINQNRRSQYQANLCMKINAKLGGVNTRWAAEVQELLKGYFGQDKQVPSLMAFGLDITHPGKREGGRSIAALVGSLDRELCRYGHQVWEESAAGGELVSVEKLGDAYSTLLQQHYKHTGCKPGCLIVYRDGVSDAELDIVRRLELAAIAQACRQLPGDGGPGTYRPRVVYVVVQKRHNVRLLKAGGQHGFSNLDAGTVVDKTVVSPWLFDFYLNSHQAIIGTSRAARYICLLDELGFGADGLQAFTYWLCYLFCRCTRSVSVVTPVYYAHLLAFRARMLSGDLGDDVSSVASGGSGGGGLPQFKQYSARLDGRMFFV